MEPQAATPTGAEAQPRPQQTEAPSPQDRIKSYLMAESGEPAQAKPAPAERAEPQAEASKEPPQAAEEPDSEASQEVEAPEAETEQTFETLSQLAEGLGWDSDKIMDLAVATKIDGKEGTVKLRDAIKSFQLESHLTQKLMAHSNEVKSFQEQANRQVQELTQRTQYLGHAHTLANELLHAEFATTNWDQLRAEDPLAFNAKTVEFQDRQRKIQQLASQLGAERQRTAQQEEAAQKAYLSEQSRLLEAKIPEWADSAKQAKEIAEIIPEAHAAYGFNEDEIRSVVDHRHLLALRDAMQWRKLQKSKPATLNKIKSAPKLLKPGTPQSRAAQQGLQTKQHQARLRETGKVRDATPLLKKLIFQ